MKLYAVVLLSSAISTTSFTATTNSLVQRSISTSLNAEIRGPTEKAEVLEFGWDGTTALGGAVDDSKPARMLDQIRASGETQSEACQLFNANLEMSGDDLMFEEFITLCDEQYESGLIEFKNGDIVNMPGENEGSAKVLSYAALADFDKEMTLKLWGQFYRDVLATPDGTDHQNIRNFMKYGWEGVDFYNGIALTKKAVGESDWDWDSESWIP
mmetsp:Transcript_29928/g.62989  ORF Transcript_29928/g.62989 Transcript_29928/m.62989 type:complete len:213 (+) Transcript_29928:56-694(+)|eukprot:CAMPEP_0171328070 /NCGR_PEP_ID=MMETSP0878-20121228/424_1 /TAXON_ID=67004 /ORGANISM="Thalassiosira weissflogii, Strain CCMP1336" /LENGTH=212 /DNA_ID=CAMNT_0011827895 /DNA_START=36 /DNA_END=674 /DNA_ORIENTATION=+